MRVDRERGRAQEHPRHRGDQEQREGETEQRRNDDRRRRLEEARPDDGVKSSARHARPHQSADQRVRAAGGNSEQPGHDIPDDGAAQRGEDDARRHDVGLDDALADDRRDVEPEDEEGDEIEERSPEHRQEGTKHARRNDGGDRVRRVMQPIEEVEQERGCDQADQQRRGKGGAHPRRAQRCSMTMALTWFATPSNLSSTFSRWP